MVMQEETFHNLNKKDPYNLLYTNNQKEVWQKTCSLREKPKKPKTFPEPPVGVFRREWQKALVDIAKDHETRQKYRAKQNLIDYKKVVVNAFKEIAWNVPKQTKDCLQVTSISDLMEPTNQRHFWYAGCKAMNKTRNFYLTTVRDQLMSLDYEQELLAPGISKYTSLPITLDDKGDITQLRYDYQKNIELHQLSFQDWLQHTNVNNLMTMGDEPLEFDEPQILKNITQLGHRDFFLANWMMDYRISRIQDVVQLHWQGSQNPMRLQTNNLKRDTKAITTPIANEITSTNAKTWELQTFTGT